MSYQASKDSCFTRNFYVVVRDGRMIAILRQNWKLELVLSKLLYTNQPTIWFSYTSSQQSDITNEFDLQNLYSNISKLLFNRKLFYVLANNVFMHNANYNIFPCLCNTVFVINFTSFVQCTFFVYRFCFAFWKFSYYKQYSYKKAVGSI